MDERKEIIERALGPLLRTLMVRWTLNNKLLVADIVDAFAKQAIVAKVMISHETYPSEHTAIDITCPTGHHGTAGEAVAIILSLEKKK